MNKNLLSILLLTVALTFSMSLRAATAELSCSGASKNVDAHYSTADPDHAVQSLEKGFTWKAETTAAGVVLTVQFLDTYVGMDAPRLFLFKKVGDAEQLVEGGDIAMDKWDAVTQTATHTLTGKSNGEEIVFLVKVAAAEGVVIFTERMRYTVGTNCETTAVETVTSTPKNTHCQKVVENGQIVIIRDGVRYNALGTQIQ